VHAQGYLGLTAIAAEVAFAHQNAQKKTLLKVIHAVSASLQAILFHRQVPRETIGKASIKLALSSAPYRES
jgi:hypothetical protein